ncbi:chaplin [Streptomyces sp. NPDC049954]|uniref:chaplin n=1 Tax=Streptomyces sp. NPDC049954 TaxID=3155779 RepID=UPI0034436A88
MRQVTRKGLITVAAASGVLAVTGGYAHADSGAQGAAVGSPGVLSGNLVQAPVDVPVNVCGNTVDVVGLLNPVFGNGCANTSADRHQADDGHHTGNKGGGHHGGGYGEERGSGGGHSWGGGAHAGGAAVGSPGIGSGNQAQVPVDVPVNACGNSISVIGLLNPAFGNNCANVETPAPPRHETPKPPKPEKPPVTPETPSTPKPPAEHVVPKAPEHPVVPVAVKAPKPQAQLAETGSELPIGAAGAAAAGLLLAGALVYRKARAGA